MKANPRPPTILVVEDDRALLEMVREMLQRNGFRVLAAEDSETAIRLSVEYQDPIQLLLTDIVLPEMSGRKLAQCLVPLNGKIAVLYMSGYGENVINRSDFGPHLLPKPFNEAQLIEKVRSALGVLVPEAQ